MSDLWSSLNAAEPKTLPLAGKPWQTCGSEEGGALHQGLCCLFVESSPIDLKRLQLGVTALHFEPWDVLSAAMATVAMPGSWTR